MREPNTTSYSPEATIDAIAGTRRDANQKTCYRAALE
jgi:hypothetical protein